MPCDGIRRILCAVVAAKDLFILVRTTKDAEDACSLVAETIGELGGGGGHGCRADGKIPNVARDGRLLDSKLERPDLLYNPTQKMRVWRSIRRISSVTACFGLRFSRIFCTTSMHRCFESGSALGAIGPKNSTFLDNSGKPGTNRLGPFAGDLQKSGHDHNQT